MRDIQTIRNEYDDAKAKNNGVRLAIYHTNQHCHPFRWMYATDDNREALDQSDDWNRLEFVTSDELSEWIRINRHTTNQFRAKVVGAVMAARD